MTNSPQSVLQQHALSAAFPSMSESDIEALAEDIKKHGQREPALIYEGQVLDGWHRYLACQQIGAEFWSDDFTGDDPIAFVISKNLHRRHLTAIQRASAVVAAHNWKAPGNPATVAGLSESAMALAAEVSPRTIRHAKAATVAGLSDEAREGKVSARQIEQVTKLTGKKRERAVQDIKDGKPPAPMKPKPDDAKLRAELIFVQGKFADLAEKNAELADTARDLQDKLEMYEAKDPDEQQQLIKSLQRKLVKAEGECDRLRIARSDAQAKNNQLIAEVKRLKRKAGEK